MSRSISIWVQNFQQGALHNGDGDPQDRWPLFVERIRASGVAPDLVLGCEAVGWSAFGHRQLARAMRDLDMDACPPSSTSRPRTPNNASSTPSEPETPASTNRPAIPAAAAVHNPSRQGCTARFGLSA
jgi:hypothetical protein